MFGIRKIENRIDVLKIIHAAQDRFRRHAKTVGLYPLQIADPQSRLRQVERIWIYLDAIELPRANQRQKVPQLPVARIEEHFFLKVFYLLQRDIEKVSRAAGRIKHFDFSQVVVKGPEQSARVAERLVRFSFRQEALNPRPRLGPIASKRRHHHRLDQSFNILAAGVLRTQLCPRVWVEPAFKECPEDRRIDCTPIKSRRRLHISYFRIG
jgi:hypothetical protein